MLANLPFRKVSDRFFFLAWLQVEIDTAVMILANSAWSAASNSSQGFARARPSIPLEERGNCGVALRQVQTRTYAAAFFATN